MKDTPDFELTSENYFSPEADRFFMSNSQYKSFSTCEFQALAKLNGKIKEEPRKAFLIGQYGHKWNENGMQAQFLNDKYSDFVETKLITKSGKPSAELEHFDDVVIPTAESCPRVMLSLKGEKEVLMTFKLFGVWWKMMLDSYNRPEGYFTDLKFLKDLKKEYNVALGFYQNIVEFRGYDTQMCLYAFGEKQFSESKDYLTPHLTIITKEKVPNKIILKGFKEVIDHKIFDDVDGVASNIDRVLAVKDGIIPDNEIQQCGVCDYCKQNRITPIISYNMLPD